MNPAPPFAWIGGNLALDFLNTVGNRLDRPTEYLSGGAELALWASLGALLPPNAELRLTRAQMTYVRSSRDELYRRVVPWASGGSPSHSDLAWLTAQIVRCAPLRRLVRAADAVCWEWRTSPRDPSAILGPVFSSAAELLTENLYRNLRQCGGERCGWLFIDRSPAGLRRWCSMADCGNRAKARAFVERRR